jgi:oligopeptide/dipeptide ABC transporter ATP-binding protein
VETLLQVRGLTVTFPTAQGPFEALSGVDLDLASGERLALMGESGCGKSVLGHAILGLMEQVSKIEGSVTFQGKDLRKLTKEELRQLRGAGMALIPQSPAAALDPVIRVGRQIDEMFVTSGRASWSGSKPMTMIRLAEVGFEDPERIYNAYPHQLSGGMCERVLIAMGTALSPELLIADEPTKGLDPASKTEVLRLLKRESEGRAMLLITHDFHAPWICGRVAIMYAGEIVEDGPVRKVLISPKHPYSIGLQGALPSQGMKPISGVMKRDDSQSCRFRNRCARRTEACEGRQILSSREKGRSVRCCNA